MTTRRPRVADVVAPASDTVAPARRTRAVPSAVANPAPTTAQLIRRSDASVSRPTYAALGVALHHFTDLVGSRANTPEGHRATTVLTKQVFGILDDHDDRDGDAALDAIRHLVTDPARPALPDGRTAREWCDQAWDDVRQTAEQRAAASCEGALEFGHDAIVNLAAVRGVGADAPWWGTATWRQRVEQLPDDAVSADGRRMLLDEPELADDQLLSMVLGVDQVTLRQGPPSAQPPASERQKVVAQAHVPSARVAAVLAS